MEIHLTLLEQIQEQIGLCAEQIMAVIEQTPAMQLLMTLPRVGPILAVVIALEVGEIEM